jgi:hypothetical protein
MLEEKAENVHNKIIAGINHWAGTFIVHQNILQYLKLESGKHLCRLQLPHLIRS